MSAAEDIAKQCWQRGSKAVNNEDFDYATDMFHKAAVLVPDNLAYRESLRAAEFKKYNNNTKGAGMLSRPKIMGLRSKLSRARSKKDWDEVDKIAEEGLKLNPWDAGFNAAIGEACKERGFSHIAIFAYRVATGPTGEPENLKLLREFAEVLQDNGHFKEAANIWRKIQKIDPNDPEARRNATAASFEQTIDAGGYDTAGSTKDVMTDQEVNKRLQKNDPRKSDSFEPGMDLATDLKHAIRKDPKNSELYLKLAQLHDSNDRFAEAKEAYQKALELTGGDRNIEELIEDVELKEMAKEIESVKKQAQKEPDNEDLKKQIGKLARQLIDREIEVYAERIIRYPQNRRIKFEQANRFFKLSRWSDAIPLYQQAGQDPRMEAEALFSLGKCFLKDNKAQLALKQFEKVQPKITYEDRGDTFKELHYLMGRLYEQGKNRDRAEHHYGEVLAVDYDFRDVRARLEGLEG